MSAPVIYRPLSEGERCLIEGMILTAPNHSVAAALDIDSLIRSLRHAKVTEMADGDMGSLLFAAKDSTEIRHFGGRLCEAEFLDSDGMGLSIVVIIDQNQELYELDIFKGDFSALVRLPKISEVIRVRYTD